MSVKDFCLFKNKKKKQSPRNTCKACTATRSKTRTLRLLSYVFKKAKDESYVTHQTCGSQEK